MIDVMAATDDPHPQCRLPRNNRDAVAATIREFLLTTQVR
jgi:hypothetical protein